MFHGAAGLGSPFAFLLERQIVSFMLQCNRQNAAMQTNGLLLASGIRKKSRVTMGGGLPSLRKGT
jgi:hypothetical protein